MAKSAIEKFLKSEATGGLVLVVAAAAAMIWANSAAGQSYVDLLNLRVAVQAGEWSLGKPLLLWINDGLMAIFFLLVGIEIKREVLQGELSSWRLASLPAIAAVGGMAMPALVYTAFNLGDGTALAGWAIPTATDIAFALGVLAVLGRRVPLSLKIFLLALAIIDDLGAIIIIAIFYTANLSGWSLGLAGVALAALFGMNRLGVNRPAPYVVVGVLLWLFVLKSGVHATLAGVALAFAIPLRTGDREPLATRLEHLLHGYVAFGILPIFAFANAGVSLEGVSLDDLLAPLPLGIALGLFLGKQLGVFGFTWAAVRLRLADLPDGASWLQVYGVSLLTGIGFTMSLFIGGLAFPGEGYSVGVRVGVLTGSIASALAGLAVLAFAATRRPAASLRPAPVMD